MYEPRADATRMGDNESVNRRRRSWTRPAPGLIALAALLGVLLMHAVSADHVVGMPLGPSQHVSRPHNVMAQDEPVSVDAATDAAASTQAHAPMPRMGMAACLITLPVVQKALRSTFPALWTNLIRSEATTANYPRGRAGPRRHPPDLTKLCVSRT